MKWTPTLIFLLLPVLSYCQAPACADLKESTVYSRSQDKHEPYKIVMKGSIQTQTNLNTGDSTIWAIRWVDDCGFTMKYLSGNDPLTPGQQEYLKHHVIALKIETITPEYYAYTVYRDRIGHQQYARDTLWIHQH